MPRECPLARLGKNKIFYNNKIQILFSDSQADDVGSTPITRSNFQALPGRLDRDLEPMSNRQPGFDESSGRTIRDAQRVRVPWMARVFPISRSTLSRQTASIAPVRSPRHTPQTSPVLSPDRPPTRSCLIARCTFRPAGSTWGTLSTLLIHGRRTACRDVWKKTGQDHPFRIGETGNARDGPLAPKTPFETG